MSSKTTFLKNSQKIYQSINIFIQYFQVKFKKLIKFNIFYRLVLYGITEEELKEHLGTLLKESHQEAEQNETQVIQSQSGYFPRCFLTNYFRSEIFRRFRKYPFYYEKFLRNS